MRCMMLAVEGESKLLGDTVEVRASCRIAVLVLVQAISGISNMTERAGISCAVCVVSCAMCVV
jgi:hypothetical protein